MNGETLSDMLRQRELETDLRQRGLSRVIAKLGTDEPARMLVAPLVEGVTAETAQACLEALDKPGRPHPGVLRLFEVEPEKAAAIALDCTLSNLSRDTTVLRLGLLIGRCIETQCRLEAHEAHDKRAFSWLFKEAQKRATNKSRMRYRLVASLSDQPVEFQGWSKEEAVAAGFLLIDAIVKATGLVELIRTYDKKRSLTLVIPTEKAHDLMTEMVRQRISTATLHGPMVCSPKPWTNVEGVWSGGYLMDALQIPLVKSKSRDFLSRLGSLPMTHHVEAMNHLMAVPYTIDAEALGFASFLIEQGIETSALPLTQRAIPEFVGDPEDAEALRAWKRMAREAHEANKQIESKRLQACQIIQTAHELSGESGIWFPINCDFRGRLNYFSGAGMLNPQGNDLNKSLIRFRQGKPITGAEFWWKLHGANEFGAKGTFQARVDWVEEHRDLIVASAMKPLEIDWWQQADSPLCFLRWCREFLRWDENPDGFLSFIPCHLDGSCNGLQHLAALTRDATAALAVNMTASDVPQDMYQIVADRIRDTFEDLVEPIDIEFAIMWARFTFDRSLTKRQCMTKSYGSTLHSCTEYTRQYVTERLEAGAEDTFGEFRHEATVWMAKRIWNSINTVVQGPQATMDFLQGLARAYNKAGKVMSWTTPSGFEVQNYYPEWKSRQVRTYIDGNAVKPRIREEIAGTISKSETVNGISANFIHSLDAAHLVATVRRLKELGVRDVLTIHDSFGVHASDIPTLATALRETFVQMYEENDLLKGLVERAKEDSVGISIEVPTKGSYSLLEVLKAPYFFS